MKEILTCEWCGDEFEPFRKKQRYCCKECRVGADRLKKKWQRLIDRKEHEEQTCIICGNKFKPRRKGQITCGGECAQKNVINKNYERKVIKHEKKVFEKRKCVICGKEFNPTTYRQIICGDKECKKIRNRDTATKRPKKPKVYVPPKKTGPSLAELAAEAKARGISYGDLIAEREQGVLCQNIARRA